jgi:hypothetical protein
MCHVVVSCLMFHVIGYVRRKLLHVLETNEVLHISGYGMCDAVIDE